jgi:signal transduction histidine kinase
VVLSVAALVILVIAYVVVGQRAARESVRDVTTFRTYVYLAILFLVTSYMTSVNSTASVLLFVAFSQVWLLAQSVRVGAWNCVVLAVMVTGGILLNENVTDSVPMIILQMSLGLAFSFLIWLWLHSILRQGVQRAELLRRLRTAQTELGRTQHAAGVTAERERVAREIHDTLAQGFTSIVMLSQTASADLDRGAHGELAERLALIERTARDNLAEARSLVAAFAPPPLTNSTLPQALTRLAEQTASESDIAVTTQVDDSAPLPSGAEVVLLRAAQESLSNVRRHSRAHNVTLTLRLSDTTACLTVTDDGVGIAPQTAEGYGLHGMRERVAAYGGTVAINPLDAQAAPGVHDDASPSRQPESDTCGTVVVLVPLDGTAAGHEALANAPIRLEKPDVR